MGEAESFNFLFNKYVRLIHKVSHQFFIQGAGYDDVFQEGSYGFLQAVKGFDFQSDFGSFAYLCIKRQIITAIKTANRNKHKFLNKYFDLCDIYLDSELVDEYIIDDEERRQLQQHLSNQLSDLELEIFTLYMNGYLPKEITQKSGYTIKTIDNALQRAKRKLSKEDSWKTQ
jgi:RNA polymerase sporulation-specific sigma factor